MENPHSERQAVLLERIVKNAVRVLYLVTKRIMTKFRCRQDKCTELVLELNHCVEVWVVQPRSPRDYAFLIPRLYFPGDSPGKRLRQDRCRPGIKIPQECTIQLGGVVGYGRRISSSTRQVTV
jgi:hypothetical protein